MEHEEYMRQALELARLAMAEGEVPVGCVIVRDGAVVGRGRNRRETAQTALGHAELEAIAQACRTLGGWRLAGCALYVTLEPCPMCAGAIVNARIPAVYYGAKDDKAGCCGSVLNRGTVSRTVGRGRTKIAKEAKALYEVLQAQQGPGPLVVDLADGRVLEAECAALLQEFFQSLR